MKQEDKYIDYLFESARAEEPQLSFEEVAEVFAASTPPTLSSLAKDWFLKNINLNSVLLLSTITLGIIAIFLFSSSNHSTEINSDKNLSVTNEIQESSPTKNNPLETEEEVVAILMEKESNIQAVKNIKPTTHFSKSNLESQKIDKSIISESPILLSIAPELRLENPFSISLAPAGINLYEEKSASDYQLEYKTVEESISPWVVGQESEMPWKITRQTKIPILNDTERVLLQFMEIKYLEQIFDKEDNGYFKPLKMLVYYSINENYFVQFNGQKIRLLNEKIAPDFDPNEPFIDVKRFKIKKAKAYFNFTYKDYHVQMQLRRVGEGWKRHKLKVKKNKEIKVNMTF